MIIGKLGIVAGRGNLPLEIADACVQEDRDFIIIAFKDHIDEESLKPYPHVLMPFGLFGKVFDYLAQNKIKTLVMAGKFQRPSLFSLKTDMKTAGFFARVAFKALGDDGFLKAIDAEFHKVGVSIIGVDAILKTSLAQAGVFTKKKPSKKDEIDIAKGFEVAKLLGKADVGQAVVVQGGVVLGLEANEGTDKLIARIKDYKLDPKGGVLIKCKKPQQDSRLDLPTIGLHTVQGAAASNLAGIAIEAGGTLIAERQKVIDEANRLGLFIIGVEP